MGLCCSAMANDDDDDGLEDPTSDSDSDSDSVANSSEATDDAGQPSDEATPLFVDHAWLQDQGSFPKRMDLVLDQFCAMTWLFLTDDERDALVDEILQTFELLVLPFIALDLEAGTAADHLFLPTDDDDHEAPPEASYRDGGFGAVPASAAAVCSLEKQMLGAGAGGNGGVAAAVTECGICLEEFVDGVEVSVMPCPSSRGHRFHPDCIAEWLGVSNMCPFCRYELPTDTGGAYDR